MRPILLKIPLLLGSAPLLSPSPGMWLYRGETSGVVAKCRLFCQASGRRGAGEVEGAQATHDFDLRSNISPFHYLSWKVKGRKKNHLPSRGISRGHLRLDGSIARICKKLVMPLPIIGQQQRINHCPFGMYGRIIHPLILFTSGCPTTHFGSVTNASGWNRKCFFRVEEVYHILSSLKLVLLHFIEDFLHCKVRSFFKIA